MNSRFLRWQLGGIAILALILLLEWGYAVVSQNELQTLLNKTIDGEYQADELPELDLPEHTADSFAAINEHPLFIEGRKPLPEKASDTPAAAEASQLEEWLLIGIYSNKNKQPGVLFRKQNEAKKFLKLNLNQSIAGWLIKQIQADRVVLEQGGQEKSVMLLKPRQQTKTPAPIPKPATPSGQQKPGQPPARPAVPPAPVAPANPIEPTNNTSPENDSDES